jgi:methionine--tRNA ligase beta chain
MITFEDFQKVEIKIGQILSVEKVEGSDKLLKLIVGFGEKEGGVAGRQIISGIAPYYPEIQNLVDKKCAFATNLEPRVIRGLESNGMILAVGDGENFSLLEVSEKVLPGSTVK